MVLGAWYYLNSDGSMKTGWLSSGSTWYFLKADGSMATGWYHVTFDGAMVAGTIKKDSKKIGKVNVPAHAGEAYTIDVNTFENGKLEAGQYKVFNYFSFHFYLKYAIIIYITRTHVLK